MDITSIAIIEDESLDTGQVLLERLRGTKKMVGMGIFYSGAILDRIKKEELWRGRGESWAAFCESEAMSYAFAQTAIRLYQMYVKKLSLPGETLEQLAQRDYTTLDKATKVITVENAPVWIPKLIHLGRHDVIAEMREENGEPPISQDAIEKVVIAYRKLLPDERAEFHRRIKQGE